MFYKKKEKEKRKGKNRQYDVIMFRRGSTCQRAIKDENLHDVESI